MASPKVTTSGIVRVPLEFMGEPFFEAAKGLAK
jgi:hypothetical protein